MFVYDGGSCGEVFLNTLFLSLSSYLSSWARCECVLKRIRFNFLGQLGRRVSERASDT